MENQLKIKKYKLVEKLGVHFEHTEQLSPVAARIFAYIILTGKIGATFDDLVSDLCASKSTISTNLAHLKSLDKIVYFTKLGDRKKYFVIHPDILLQNMDKMILEWKSERELHQEVLDYKQEINNLDTTTEELKFGLTYHENYIKFTNLAIASMRDLKSKVAAMNNQTKS